MPAPAGIYTTETRMICSYKRGGVIQQLLLLRGYVGYDTAGVVVIRMILYDMVQQQNKHVEVRIKYMRKIGAFEWLKKRPPYHSRKSARRSESQTPHYPPPPARAMSEGTVLFCFLAHTWTRLQRLFYYLPLVSTTYNVCSAFMFLDLFFVNTSYHTYVRPSSRFFNAR